MFEPNSAHILRSIYYSKDEWSRILTTIKSKHAYKRIHANAVNDINEWLIWIQ